MSALEFRLLLQESGSRLFANGMKFYGGTGGLEMRDYGISVCRVERWVVLDGLEILGVFGVFVTDGLEIMTSGLERKRVYL